MSFFLRDLPLLVGIGIAMVLGLNKAADHQLTTAAQHCHCTCAVMADWPAADLVRPPFAFLLERGETLRYAWGGGAVVCLRPDERNPRARFIGLHLAVEDQLRRLEAQQ